MRGRVETVKAVPEDNGEYGAKYEGRRKLVASFFALPEGGDPVHCSPVSQLESLGEKKYSDVGEHCRYRLVESESAMRGRIRGGGGDSVELLAERCCSLSRGELERWKGDGASQGTHAAFVAGEDDGCGAGGGNGSCDITNQLVLYRTPMPVTLYLATGFQ